MQVVAGRQEGRKAGRQEGRKAGFGEVSEGQCRLGYHLYRTIMMRQICVGLAVV